MKQSSFQKRNWKHALCHGGTLRQKQAGRGFRPLSGRESVHLVLKANRASLKSGFRSYKCYFLIQSLVEKYGRRFWIRIEQISIQGDHIHLLIRANRRSQYQSFFRVLAGQIAQRFEHYGFVTATPKGRQGGNEVTVSFWKHRPFTRVIRGGRRVYQTAKNYIRLNEKEALGEIKYKKERLKGLNEKEWEALWS